MKRRLGRALCVLLGAAFLIAGMPLVGARVGHAQDAKRPSKSARVRRAASADTSRAREGAHRAPRKKHGRDKPARAAAASAAASDASQATPRAHDKTRGRAETRAPEATTKGEAAQSAAAAAAQQSAAGVNAQIVKEGDTSVKVMEFTGLGIEGRLKSPQLVYFVQRVRAEFDRPLLPHRSFMPELAASTAREPVR